MEGSIETSRGYIRLGAIFDGHEDTDATHVRELVEIVKNEIAARAERGEPGFYE